MHRLKLLTQTSQGVSGESGPRNRTELTESAPHALRSLTSHILAACKLSKANMVIMQCFEAIVRDQASLQPPPRSLKPSRGASLSAADHLSSWASVLSFVPGLSISACSSSLPEGIRGFPPMLASTISLSAVGASMIRSSLAVNIIGKTFERRGMRAMMRTGKPDQ